MWKSNFGEFSVLAHLVLQCCSAIALLYVPRMKRHDAQETVLSLHPGKARSLMFPDEGAEESNGNLAMSYQRKF